MIDRGRCLSSQDLLQGGQQVLIEHEREVYVLRVTRQGKLILTK
ncbi:hemin uptake protein HemP [Marinospirillum sp.]